VSSKVVADLHHMLPQDLSAQGRILRVAAMIGERGYDVCMEMMKLEKERGREWRENSEEIMSQMVAASKTVGTGEQLGDSQRQAVSQYLLQGDAKGYRNYYVQQASIDLAKSLLLVCVIRRTGQSRTPDGTLVLDVKPYIESVMWTVQRADELKAILWLQQKLMAEKQEGYVFIDDDMLNNST
jgi:hypothetical protein